MAGDFASIKFGLDPSSQKAIEGPLQAIIDKYTGKEFKIKFTVESNDVEKKIKDFRRTIIQTQQSAKTLSPVKFASDDIDKLIRKTKEWQSALVTSAKNPQSQSLANNRDRLKNEVSELRERIKVYGDYGQKLLLAKGYYDQLTESRKKYAAALNLQNEKNQNILAKQTQKQTEKYVTGDVDALIKKYKELSSARIKALQYDSESKIGKSKENRVQELQSEVNTLRDNIKQYGELGKQLLMTRGYYDLLSEARKQYRAAINDKNGKSADKELLVEQKESAQQIAAVQKQTTQYAIQDVNKLISVYKELSKARIDALKYDSTSNQGQAKQNRVAELQHEVTALRANIDQYGELGKKLMLTKGYYDLLVSTRKQYQAELNNQQGKAQDSASAKALQEEAEAEKAAAQQLANAQKQREQYATADVNKLIQKYRELSNARIDALKYDSASSQGQAKQNRVAELQQEVSALRAIVTQYGELGKQLLLTNGYYDLLTESRKQYANALNNQKGKEYDQNFAKSQQEAVKAIDSVNAALDKLQYKAGEVYPKMSLDANTAAFQEYRTALDELTALRDRFVASGAQQQDGVFNEAQLQMVGEMTAAVERYSAARENLERKAAKADAEQNRRTAAAKAVAQLTEFWTQYGDSISRNGDAVRQYYELLDRAKSSATNATINQNELTESIKNFKSEMQSAGLTQKNFWQQLKSGFGNKLFYGVMGYAAMYARRSFRQLFTNVKEIDSAMTQLQVVTNSTGSEMSGYFDQAAASAQKLGVSVTDLVDSMTTFARLGFTGDESGVFAEYTAMLTKVGDIDISSAQDAVTSIIKTFDLGVDDIEYAMDQMVEIGNNFPISVSGLAEGINNAGSALHAAGNNLAQSMALLTAANSTVQDAAKSSTALRTMAARLRKTDATAMPEGEEAITSAKYDELVKSLTKYQVALVDTNNEYRSTYDIIKDISAVWDEMTSMEQSAIAEAVGSTRNQNVFFSMVEQFQEAEGAFEAAKNASGAMADAYDDVINSIEGKLGQLQASFQTMSFDFISSNTVKTAIDLATGIVQIADALAKVNVLLPAILTTIVTIKSVGGPKTTGLNCAHEVLAREGSNPVEAGTSERAA